MCHQFQTGANFTSVKIRRAETVLNTAAASLANTMEKYSGVLTKFEPLRVRDVADIKVPAQDLGSKLEAERAIRSAPKFLGCLHRKVVHKISSVREQGSCVCQGLYAALIAK
jgi:hypothetical protein